jgi:hypothetical protein
MKYQGLYQMYNLDFDNYDSTYYYVDDKVLNNTNIHDTSLEKVKFSTFREIVAIFGLYIDTAMTRSEYLSKLNKLNYLLYENKYNLPFVKIFIENVIIDIINIENNIRYATYLIEIAFDISHNNLIQIFYKNKDKFIIFNRDNHFNLNFINFIYKFNSNIQIDEFITNLESDINLNHFLYEILIYNYKISLVDLFVKYYIDGFKIFFDLEFENFIKYLLDIKCKTTECINLRFDLIKYFIENNICNILSRDYESNNFLICLIQYCNNLELIYKIINFIKNKKIFNRLLRKRDYDGNTCLYYIISFHYGDITLLSYLTNDIYRNINNYGQNCLYYNISNLNLESYTYFINKIIQLRLTNITNDEIDNIIAYQKLQYYIEDTNQYIVFLNSLKK